MKPWSDWGPDGDLEVVFVGVSGSNVAEVGMSTAGAGARALAIAAEPGRRGAGWCVAILDDDDDNDDDAAEANMICDGPEGSF